MLDERINGLSMKRIRKTADAEARADKSEQRADDQQAEIIVLREQATVPRPTPLHAPHPAAPPPRRRTRTLPAPRTAAHSSSRA